MPNTWAKQFLQEGVRAAAVYAGSAIGRSEALKQLADGQLDVIFSVDLFNEGVDLPSIDTVLMLRPTESKILFLQQLGRGLRLASGKDQLVVIDFIGNHHSFLHKPQALAQVGATYRQLAAFARQVEEGRLQLPAGCFINYDPRLIDFLKQLDANGTKEDYEALKAVLGRRPTLVEFYRSGTSMQRMSQQYGHWFALVEDRGDLSDVERAAARVHSAFLLELEKTRLTKSFKMVLLEAFQELDGWRTSPTLALLAQRSWQVLQRRRPLLVDLPDDLLDTGDGTSVGWQSYWRSNPVNAWIGGNVSESAPRFFQLEGELFKPSFAVDDGQREVVAGLVQEIIDYRLATYEARQTTDMPSAEVVPLDRYRRSRIELPYFPNLPIACGHFKAGRADAEKLVSIGSGYGSLDPARNFIARASGNSMNGGKSPIRDGDYLLLEVVNATKAGSITGNTMAIERQDETGDNQYLLRVVTKTKDGRYILKANNPDYADLEANDEMRTFARLRAVVDPLDLALGQSFLREDIPPLFGEIYNPGNWNSGHIVLKERKAHILLVTLNKQGKAEDHHYIDHWIDNTTFHWQSQNSTTSSSTRGRGLINHSTLGISLHLFVRERKLHGGKGAPFTYQGRVEYVRHTGEAPMSVILRLVD
jgi:hypothetical protein